jgi:hypothetical protein
MTTTKPKRPDVALAFSLDAEVSPGLLDRADGSLHLTAKVLRATDDGPRGITWTGHESARRCRAGTWAI